MNVKITIEDASPEELALVLNNLNKLDTGSTMAVEGKTKDFNLGAKQASATETTAAVETETASTAPAKPAKEPTTRTSSRKTKAETEKANQAERTTTRDDRDDERRSSRDDRDDRDDDRRVNRGSLLEKVGELAAELAGFYRSETRAKQAVQDVLAPFGAKEIDDLAPADYTAAIEAFKAEIARE
jgi:hypothetical protein